MADAATQPAKWKKVATNATKLALGLLIVGIGIQTAMSFFENRTSEVKPIAEAKTEAELGSWTFAGEGLGVTVRAVEAGKVDDELRGSGPTAEPPTGKIRDGETRILELLKDQPPSETTPEGRQRWRQSLAGIEVFAETCKVGNDVRLVLARAAWSSGGEGFSLLEIRPQGDSGGNQSTTESSFPTPEGATEMARRVSPDGKATGSLFMTKAAMEATVDAMKGALSAKGWSVETIEAGDGSAAKSLACQKNDERMQVVVFRDEGAAGQTMILCVQE